MAEQKKEQDKGSQDHKDNQERIPDEKSWSKNKDTDKEDKIRPVKQGDKSDFLEDPTSTEEYKKSDPKERGVAKIEEAASGAEMIPDDAIVDPGVNPWKLREGNEFLKRDLGFSNGKCVANTAIAGKLKSLREKGKFSGEVSKEIEAIEAELTASAQ